MNEPGQFRIESTGETGPASAAARIDMDSDIQFGQLEQAQPEPGLRPDRDKHFAVTECGVVNDNELPIFVDMDVLRDMEAHARENTRVELGGVMLGRQHLDEFGKPFVVITDSLRAKHYEATKGSFKFTHDTWSQITRERNEFKNDLEMVGWYHTHPGWGVFLSGMDLFICNNFFSKQLDVALVIDPCAGDRGWFQWGDAGETRQTAGFFLMTNRHRRNELNYFTEVFREPDPNLHDPRFSQASFSNQQFQEREDMVNVIDNRRPVFDFAIVMMLFLQMSLVAFLGYRLLENSDDQPDAELQAEVAALQADVRADNDRRNASVREQAYQSILNQIVAGETGADGLVEQFAQIKQENMLLSKNREGLLAGIENLRNSKDNVTYKLSSEKEKSKKIQDELLQALNSLQEVQKVNDKLKAEVAAIGGEETLSSIIPAWLMYTMGGIGLVAMGVVGGAWYVRSSLQDEESYVQSYQTIDKNQTSERTSDPKKLDEEEKVSG